MPRPFNTPEKILSNYVVDPITGCWLWLGGKAGKGYGCSTLNWKHIVVHVFFYEHFKGPVPEGLDLDHLCHIRHCCNPNHLEPVTRAVNIRRGKSTILNEQQVTEIRQKFILGVDQYWLAAQYKVHKGTISKIISRNRWKNI